MDILKIIQQKYNIGIGEADILTVKLWREDTVRPDNTTSLLDYLSVIFN